MSSGSEDMVEVNADDLVPEPRIVAGHKDSFFATVRLRLIHQCVKCLQLELRSWLTLTQDVDII